MLMWLVQGDVDKELKAETEKNKDDITHLEMLDTHYQQRCDAYEVCNRDC